MRTESSSMPRKMKHVVGPTRLSGDKGMPISIALRREEHILELGGPNVK